MLPYTIYPTLLQLGPFNITSWGFMVALGFLVALFFISKEAKRRKFDLDQVYNLAIFVILGGIIGARLGWFLTEGGGTLFTGILQFWKGGLIWHGGLIGALLTAYVYVKIKKINFWEYADIFALGLPLGHAIGRIGCYLSGYHIGKATSVPWAILFDGQLRHPVALYEIVLLIPLFFILWNIRKKELFKGALFSIYLIGYAVIRFGLDFLRVDPTYLGLTIAQYFAITLFLFGSFFIVDKLKGGKK